MMEPRETAQVVAYIAAAYPQWPATAETVAVYAEALADLDHPAVVDAVRELILTSDRWPTVATIRRRVADRNGMLAPTPAQAWAEITEHFTDAGRPEWTHAAIAETVRTIGWWNLRTTTNLETMRAQFLRLYADIQERSDRSVLIEPGQVMLTATTVPVLDTVAG